jgi:hypothetical protein
LLKRNAIRTILPAMCAAMLVPLFAAPSVLASTTSSPDLETRLEQMQQEIERLREENKSFREVIDQLRAATQDDWLTEQRAEEIRGIVYDVLADADTRSNLVGDGLMAGWRDGFFLASADGRFKLNISGQVQFRFLYNYHDQTPGAFEQPANVVEGKHKRGFENTRTRLAFSGHLFTPDLTYFVRGNFRRDRQEIPQGGGFFLEDAWLRYHLNNEFSLRIGQFRLPFTREFLVDSSRQLAVERSVIDNELNIGRSQGIEVTWASGASKFSGAFSDGGVDNLGGPQPGIAVFHDPRSSAALRTGAEYAWTFRYEHLVAGSWEQFQDITSPMHDEFGVLIGVAGHMQRTEATGQPPNPFQPGRRDIKWFAYTVDASIEFGGANLFGSFTHHYIDQPTRHINIFGVVAQGGMYITPKIEAFARYEFGKWSFDAPPGNEDFIEPLHMVTTGVNYYLDGHDVKWTTDIGVAFTQVGRGWGRSPAGITGWRSENTEAKPQIVFRTQFQLLF